MNADRAVLVTCEHGGNHVPAECAQWFAGREELLNSHRGYDIGALDLARRFAETLDATLVYSVTTRLLADLNRSPGNHALFSEVTAPLPRPERQRVLDAYYHPHRERVESILRKWIESGRRAYHVGVHTFTPVLEGKVRNVDAGILYDPSRAAEKTFAILWQKTLALSAPGLLVRRNTPYRGVADGLVPHLRTRFPEDRYIGFELELNQKFPLEEPERWREIQNAAADSFLETLRIAETPERPGVNPVP